MRRHRLPRPHCHPRIARSERHHPRTDPGEASDFGDPPGSAADGHAVPARIGDRPGAAWIYDPGGDQQGYLHRDQPLMSIVRRIFPSATDALRPRLACEITPLGVLAGRPGSVAVAGEAQDVMTSFAPLRMGTLTPGLKPPNMTDRAAVASAMRQA